MYYNFNTKPLNFYNILQFQGVFSIITGLFEIYCLSLAYPGAVHYGYYLFSFDFVYVGNPHGNLYTTQVAKIVVIHNELG